MGLGGGGGGITNQCVVTVTKYMFFAYVGLKADTTSCDCHTDEKLFQIGGSQLQWSLSCLQWHQIFCPNCVCSNQYQWQIQTLSCRLFFLLWFLYLPPPPPGGGGADPQALSLRIGAVIVASFNSHSGVAVILFIKARSGAQAFIWKWVSFVCISKWNLSFTIYRDGNHDSLWERPRLR